MSQYKFVPKWLRQEHQQGATAHVLSENGQILAQDVDGIGKLAMD